MLSEMYYIKNRKLQILPLDLSPSCGNGRDRNSSSSNLNSILKTLDPPGEERLNSFRVEERLVTYLTRLIPFTTLASALSACNFRLFPRNVLFVDFSKTQ